ncbi:MAG: hypothetical protein QG597_1899 [Actinomycetota bacterium]|nr:hypothetical protein [Actinomycetota bacterium]
MNTARHLRLAPTDAEVLAGEISAICAQIDRRLGNPPGTAENGIYFWLGPPGWQSAEVLAALHRDALTFLLDLTTTTERHNP